MDDRLVATVGLEPAAVDLDALQHAALGCGMLIGISCISCD